MSSIALSIHQPWAHFIIHCGKDIENRGWNARFRGPILIHASKAMTRYEYEEAVSLAERIGVDPQSIPEPEALPRGGIIGRVNMTDCVSDSDSPWFFGEYGFVLHNPVPLPFTPCRGHLGFFKI